MVENKEVLFKPYDFIIIETNDIYLINYLNDNPKYLEDFLQEMDYPFPLKIGNKLYHNNDMDKLEKLRKFAHNISSTAMGFYLENSDIFNQNTYKLLNIFQNMRNCKVVSVENIYKLRESKRRNIIKVFVKNKK